MGRLQLFEFQDFSWFPSAWRDYITDYLRFLAEKAGLYRPMVPKIAALLEELGESRIVDLCSGGGGPLVWLHSKLNQEHGRAVPVVMTDLFPNAAAFEVVETRSKGLLTGYREPVDATTVPDELNGVRTLFGAFHHFTPSQAQQILEDAAHKAQPIVVMESTARSVKALLWMFFVPLVLFLVTPLIRPFRIGRLFWTYIVPVIHFFAVWDGIVSCLRTYNPKELRALTTKIDAPVYSWDIGKAKRGLVSVTYLIGRPRALGSDGH